MKTVAQLRQAGYKVYVKHGRALDAYGNFRPKGGTTLVEICKDEKPIGKGLAECSKRDSFDRKRGLTIALGRAVKKAQREGYDLT